MFKEVEFVNEDFYDGPFSRQDFTRSEFVNCDFHNCDFERADFLGAIFTNCDFYRCKLNSYITGVRFTNCDFIDCSLDEAYIFRTQFKNCDFSCISMNDTMLSTVDFDGTEFRNVRWKGTCINSAPLIVEGIEYPVVALDNGYVHIGCEFNTYEYFYTRNDRYVASTEGLRSARFWKKNKSWIFKMFSDRGLYNGQS